MEFLLKVLTVKDSLELAEKFKGVFDVGDNFEVSLNILLKRSFN